MYIFPNRPCTTRLTMAIVWDAVIIENTLLALIIVGSIYFERWLEDKAHLRKEIETKKSTINFIINDLENKLRFIEESQQYKDYKPFFTDMWDAIIMTGRHSLLSFETFRDLQHTYSWMKYYNTELDLGKNQESVIKDLLKEVSKSINQSLENLAVVMDKFDRRN
jgi:hypothetical protein